MVLDCTDAARMRGVMLEQQQELEASRGRNARFSSSTPTLIGCPVPCSLAAPDLLLQVTLASRWRLLTPNSLSKVELYSCIVSSVETCAEMSRNDSMGSFNMFPNDSTIVSLAPLTWMLTSPSDQLSHPQRVRVEASA